MPSQKPERIALDPDAYHARHVGWTPAGQQFFLTTPFVPASRASKGSEYVALFLFDEDGHLVEAHIDDFGPRSEMDVAAASACHTRRLKAYGPLTPKRIEVCPFSVERFGVEFGLIPRAPAEDGDPWAVELQPGNSMAFFEPWDDGFYDT